MKGQDGQVRAGKIARYWQTQVSLHLLANSPLAALFQNSARGSVGSLASLLQDGVLQLQKRKFPSAQVRHQVRKNQFRGSAPRITSFCRRFGKGGGSARDVGVEALRRFGDTTRNLRSRAKRGRCSRGAGADFTEMLRSADSCAIARTAADGLAA